MALVVDSLTMTLNKAWQPIGFVTVGSAICTVMREVAFILCPKTFRLMSFEDWLDSAPSSDRVIKTPRRPIPAPEIIVLRNYDQRPPRRVALCRPNIYRRDGFACQYCGVVLPSSRLTVDHVIPRSRGGAFSWRNVATACRVCNEKKSNLTPKEARMKLRHEPRSPAWAPVLSVPQPVFPSWIPFLEKEGAA